MYGAGLLEERPYAEVMYETVAHFAGETDIEPDRMTEAQSHAIKTMEAASQAVQTPLARVEHALLRRHRTAGWRRITLW